MQAWTILDENDNLIYPSFITAGPDVEPPAEGWDYTEGEKFIPINFSLDPSVDIWINGEWTKNLEVLKQDQWVKIRTNRDAERYGGFVSFKGKVDTDLQSQNRIANVAGRAISFPDTFPVNWTMFDNSSVPLTAEEMMQLNLEVSTFDDACQTKGQSLRETIMNATTIEDIQSVTWYDEEPTQ